jgi:hypothetical protein
MSLAFSMSPSMEVWSTSSGATSASDTPFRLIHMTSRSSSGRALT